MDKFPFMKGEMLTQDESATTQRFINNWEGYIVFASPCFSEKNGAERKCQSVWNDAEFINFSKGCFLIVSPPSIYLFFLVILKRIIVYLFIPPAKFSPPDEVVRDPRTTEVVE